MALQELTESIEHMNAKNLNYWLSKFIQEVENELGGRYPSQTLDSIVCSLKRSNFCCLRSYLVRINLFISRFFFLEFSRYLDTISKSLKIVIKFFIGYSNASMSHGTQLLIGGLEL